MPVMTRVQEPLLLLLLPLLLVMAMSGAEPVTKSKKSVLERSSVRNGSLISMPTTDDDDDAITISVTRSNICMRSWGSLASPLLLLLLLVLLPLLLLLLLVRVLQAAAR
uniref:Secreted protein n=1 Tax=Anopheles darlingi TaxID=43151 RepID=A0A2M4D540_ANODA